MMKKTFTNPVFIEGPDPWVYRESPDCYYFIRTTGTSLELFRSKTLSGIGKGESKVIWTAPKEGSCCHNVWAPESHKIDGVWYIYFSADDYKGTVPEDYGIGHTTRTRACAGVSGRRPDDRKLGTQRPDRLRPSGY